MKLEIEMLQKEYESVLSGYAMLLAYRLMNLCVKADANSLLPAVVYVKGSAKKIEEVADVGIRSEDVMEVYPFHEDLINPIGLAIKEVHPEFKQKLETIHIEEAKKDFKYLSLTMPEVDQPRHDVLLQGVDVCADVTKGQTEAAKVQYTARLEKELLDSPGEEVDEAHDNFDAVLDEHNKRVQSILDDKHNEIEEALQRFQQKLAEQAQSQLEQMQAQGADVTSQLQMPSDQ